MKCNLPRSFYQLPKSEQNALKESLTKQFHHCLDKEEAEVQDIWIKFACIVLRDRLKLDEEELVNFIVGWNRVYSKNARIKNKEEQTAWLDEEMKKCFPKNGFPQARIDHLKEKVC